MSAPYCSVDGCHDTRVWYYAHGGTTGTTTTPRIMAAPLVISAVPAWGTAYCRIHALQTFKCAFGGRP